MRMTEQSILVEKNEGEVSVCVRTCACVLLIFFLAIAVGGAVVTITFMYLDSIGRAR